MNSLPKFDLSAKTQTFVSLYVKLTNQPLHMTDVAKCHNLHAVTSVHRGVLDNVGKYHHVSAFCTEDDVAMQNTKQDQGHNAGANQVDVGGHMGVCRVTFKRFGYMTGQGQTDRGQLPQTKLDIYLVDSPSG